MIRRVENSVSLSSMTCSDLMNSNKSMNPRFSRYYVAEFQSGTGIKKAAINKQPLGSCYDRVNYITRFRWRLNPR